ncbi:MAG TPA: methyltransferase domain-containing protein [Sedimentisphaerales bacterium]|nr:methyltransferase domain-containing protein [Sedimentisphaerales bacterium]
MNEELKNQQEIYDKGWRKELAAGKEQRGNLQTNLEFLTETNLLKQNDRILEIGCGIGSIVSELSGQGYDITGTDISGEAIAYGLKKYGDIKLEVQPAEDLQFEDQTFDVVLSFDLFEHIARIDKHISEVHRVLRQDGYYLLQTPNKYSNVIFETLYHKSFIWRRAHPSLHTPGRLKRRLSGHGFEIQFVKMNPVNEFTLNKLRKKLGLISNIFKHINFRRLPLALQTNLYVIAHKTFSK